MHEIDAAVMREPGQISHESIQLEEPKADEVLVDIRATGVCHTDYHTYTDEEADCPVVLGHEGAGVVEEVGDQVTELEPGDHVVLWVLPSCGHCKHCAAGNPYLCSQHVEIRGEMPDRTKRLHDENGSIDHFFAQSSFATKAVVPKRSAVPIRSDIPFEIAALLGCGIPTGMGAVLNTAGVESGDDVVVFGCGGVGASAVMAADLAGARKIIAVDIATEKLEQMRSIGATDVVDASVEDPVEAIEKLTGGVDYSFECIGQPQTIEQAFQSLDSGGTAVATTTKETGSLEIDGSAFLTGVSLVGNIVGSIQPRADIPKLADLYAEGKLNLDALLTETYALDELEDAFESLHSGDGIRSVIQMDS